MGFTGAYINKAQGGLARGEASDRVAVLIAGCPEIAGKLEHHKRYELLQIEDAEMIGITESLDATGILVHHHLQECFRLSPRTAVNLLAVPPGTKVSDLKTLPAAISALRSVPGLNTIAVAGLQADAALKDAASGMQILVDNFASEFIYIDSVLVEGLGGYLTDPVTAYPDLRTFDCPNVSVVIVQDPAKAAELPAYTGYAAVGSALGMLLVRAVHENLGSVDIEQKPRGRFIEGDYPLTDTRLGRWESAALSNGKPFPELGYDTDQKKLDDLGYIYAGSFAGYGGFFFSNSHTCTEKDSDYAFIERNAIWNKAARIIRQTLIPRVRSKVEADPATGYIKSTTISDWDGRVRKALTAMVTAGNVADFDIYIDPSQSAVSNNPFRIKVQLVANGIVHEFDVDLGFTNSIS